MMKNAKNHPPSDPRSVLLLEDHSTEGDRVVRVLTLNRPEKKNAITAELAAALWGALAAADADPSVGAAVLRGAGGDFCGGVDVHVFLAIGRGEMEGLDKIENLHQALIAFKKPLLASVDGMAVGMGVTLLPHFDVVYASRRASFMTPFVRLGLILEYGSSFTLPRLIGRQRAEEMILSGRPIDAATAERWGLVGRVVAQEGLDERVLDLAGAMAAHPPKAVALCKELLRRGEEETSLEAAVEREHGLLRTLYGSAENVAAVEAFLASRRG